MEQTTKPAPATLEDRVAVLENELAAMAQLARILAISADSLREPEQRDVDQRFHFAVLRAAAMVCQQDAPRSLLLTYLAKPSNQLPAADLKPLEVVAGELAVGQADDVQSLGADESKGPV